MFALIGACLILTGTLAHALFEWRRQETKLAIIRLARSEDPDDREVAELMHRRHELYLEQLTPRQRISYWGWRALLITGNVAVVIYLAQDLTGR